MALPKPASGEEWLRADTLGAQLLINVLGLALPITILQVYDRVLKNEAVSTLFFLTLFLAVAFLLDFILRLAQGLLRNGVAARYEHRTMMRVSRALFSRSTAGKDTGTTGSMMDDFKAIQKIKDFYHGSTVNILVEIPFVLIYFLLMAVIAGWLKRAWTLDAAPPAWATASGMSASW